MQLYVDILRSALQDYVLSGRLPANAAGARLVFLRNGGLSLGTTRDVRGPALCLLPLHDPSPARLRAGSSGLQILAGDRAMLDATAPVPELVDLRSAMVRPITADLTDKPQVAQDIATAFDILRRESLNEDRGGGALMTAQFRTLLLLLWRHCPHDPVEHVAEPAAHQILQAFRQLLETRFRERWGVAQYASELNLTTDRLHAICTRLLGRAPLALIHERSSFEAQALLLRSNRTVDQIAYLLGFRSAGQFSTFFKKHVGQPPNEYRKARRAAADLNTVETPLRFADWP